MKQLVRYRAALLLLLSCSVSQMAFSQASEPYLGEIQTFAFNFCPTGWAPANGQLLPINQYEALFNLLGTTYGGDGISTFALPKLGPTYTANGGALHSCIALSGVYPSQN
jgi:microcystin-dependent protein